MSSEYEKFLWGETESEDAAQRGRAFMHLAENAIHMGDYHRALTFNESAKANYIEAGDQENVSDCRIQQARILALMGNHDDALKELEACSIEVRADAHEAALGKIVALEAEVYLAKEQFEKAEDCFKSSIQLYKSDGENSELVRVSVDYADFLHQRGRLDEALEVIQFAEASKDEADNARHLAELALKKGRVLTGLGKRNEAFEALEEAHESFMFLDITSRIHEAELAIAKAHNAFGEYGQALGFGISGDQQLLNFSRTFGRAAKMRLKFMLERATSHLGLEQLDEARETASKCAKIASTLGFRKIQVRALRLLSEISTKDSNLDAVEAFLRQALEANAKQQKPAQCRSIKLSLAIILVDKGSDQEVVDLLESFDVYSWPKGNFENRQLYFGCLMVAYFQLGNLEQAHLLAKLVLENAIVEGAVSESAMMAHDTLSDVYGHWGKPDQAREHGIKALAMAVELEQQPVAQRLSKRWLA